MKKLLALVLAAAMVLALVPMTAMALPKAGLEEITPPKAGDSTLSSGYGPVVPLTVDYLYGLKFTAEDTSIDSTDPYADWRVDFKVKISHDVMTDQIRLAGHYGSFGWLEVQPEDLLGENQPITAGEYPVMGSFLGSGIPYEEVVNSVKEFMCAFYVDPAVLEEHPDFTVELSLVMVDPTTGEEHLVGETSEWPVPESMPTPTPTPTLDPTPIPEEAPIPETGDGMGLFAAAGLMIAAMLGMVTLRKREQN